jgi:hypothetical protein
MRRSRRHLLGLALLSGVICVVVVLADASRVWLAAGPAAIAVLDTFAFSGFATRKVAPLLRRPGRRLARRPGGLAHDYMLVDFGWPILRWLVAVLGGVATAILAAFHTSSSLWLLLPIGVVVVAVLLPLALDAFAALLARTHPTHHDVDVTRDFRRHRVSDIQEAARGLSHIHLGPGALSLGLVLPIGATAGPLDVLAITSPEQPQERIDAELALARQRTLEIEHDRQREGVCEIVEAGPSARLVVADHSSRSTFLAVFRDSAGARDVRVGEATYPEDGSTLIGLGVAALSRQKRLSDL